MASGRTTPASDNVSRVNITTDAHLPTIEANDPAHSPHEPKPSWRGWIHAGALPVVIVATLLLLVFTPGLMPRLVCALYGLSSILLFGISALYHRFNWSPRVRLALKRFDHANIFLLIASTYSPISLLGLREPESLILFFSVWSVAILGIFFRIFWTSAPRWLYVALYLALGWSAVMFLPALLQANWVMMLLVAIGGILYTIGAVAYGMKKPNPWPGHFGFHELFHACTVLAYLCHWTAVLIIALNPVNLG
ncbi:hemolysin III family protein [Pseudoclavibacter alba]|uniref:PAQR family membrane homeostasis protein TrhA n=1 Tax=Pseudoclavibacter albus TaxID=272241 RepID=UPI0019D081D2|nr:hemolysin III family protein [Pseudoclavibacter alba]MBN6777539.1 hemolysin III family protein [Pseudoclavibacter alba]